MSLCDLGKDQKPDDKFLNVQIKILINPTNDYVVGKMARSYGKNLSRVEGSASQPSQLKGTQSAMGPRWPGHYFCQFEKRLPQPEIKCTRRIHLEIRFNLA